MLEVGSLYTGGGGGDLGMEEAGMTVVWQVENNKHCLMLLKIRWPLAIREHDVTRIDYTRLKPVDLIIGGDPCQCRSRAKGGRVSKYPDLSGYFLAVVGRMRSRWVVRENVPSSDVITFKLALEALGYGVLIIELDAADFTAQSRRRQFVIGSLDYSESELGEAFHHAPGVIRNNKKAPRERETLASCITTHPLRYSESDNLVWERQEGKLRLFCPEERERLQGFPVGWTAGFSFYRRCILLGNAMNVAVVEWIGRIIIRLDKSGGKID